MVTFKESFSKSQEAFFHRERQKNPHTIYTKTRLNSVALFKKTKTDIWYAAPASRDLFH